MHHHHTPDLSPAAVERFRANLKRRFPRVGPHLHRAVGCRTSGAYVTDRVHKVWESPTRLSGAANDRLQALMEQKAVFTSIGWGDGSEAGHALEICGFLLVVTCGGDLELYQRYTYSEDVGENDGAYVFGPDDIYSIHE
jgi:hypothetical protein